MYLVLVFVLLFMLRVIITMQDCRANVHAVVVYLLPVLSM